MFRHAHMIGESIPPFHQEVKYPDHPYKRMIRRNFYIGGTGLAGLAIINWSKFFQSNGSFYAATGLITLASFMAIRYNKMFYRENY